ncbi:MAG: hypothetical protein KJ630_19110 [Proteobacteria bacterium]|nr:hypothetical protein [Pseudomonadota bacterium]
MPSLKFDIIVDGRGGKVAMKQFADETDAAFKRAAASVNRVSLAALPKHEQAVVKVQRKYQSLGSQIDKLAKSGRITNHMAASFHDDIGTRMTGDLKALERAGNKTFQALSKAAKVAAAAMTLAFAVVSKKTFTDAFNAVEDYKMRVASLSAFIATFSQKSAQGDLAGGFKEANEYAQRLVVSLEKIDAKTIATGKDLGVMAETMIQNGVLLDIDNQRQVQGFKNIANALKLVTAGQNADIQMRQEINALLMGQVRATDRLPKLLSAIDPQLQTHLKLWKEQGTTIENVGELLAGFGESASLIEATWAAVGSSLETVRDRVLRDGFKPIYVDILALANGIRSSMVATSGELTPLAKNIQLSIGNAYKSLKLGAMEVKAEILRIGMLLDKIGGTMTLIASLPSAIPAALGIDSSEKRMEGLAAKNLEYEERYLEKDRELLLLAEQYNAVKEKTVTLPEVNFAKAPELTAVAPDTAEAEKAIAKQKQEDARAIARAVKEETAARKELNEMLARQEKLTDEVIAGEETLAKAMMSESERSVAAIQDKYWEYDKLIQQQVAMGNQTEEWARITHEALGVKMQEDLANLQEKSETVADKMKEAFVGWANNMSSNLTDVVWGAELSFSSILEMFGKMLTQMVIQYQIVQPLLEGLFSMGGSSTVGSTGMTGGVDIGIAHAASGYDIPRGVNPLVQAHSEEMILPANLANKIRNGVGGGGAVTNVVINNNSSKTTATATEVKNASGGKDIMVMIDEIVGKAIMSGRGQTAKAMSSVYGASRTVVGR